MNKPDLNKVNATSPKHLQSAIDAAEVALPLLRAAELDDDPAIALMRLTTANDHLSGALREIAAASESLQGQAGQGYQSDLPILNSARASGLDTRAFNFLVDICLKHEIKEVGELNRMRCATMLKSPGGGPKIVECIVEFASKYGVEIH